MTRHNCGNIISSVISFLVIPAIFLCGIFLFPQHYMLTAVLLIFAVLTLFFISFEKSTLVARELVPVAVMAAFAVVSRAAFFFAPQFKPVAAVVIIAGAAFGCRNGFICGAVCMLVSNFIFGQGPWTPFQMLGMGIAGVTGGLAGRSKFLIKPIPLCVLGVLAVFFYGFLSDTWMLLSAGEALNYAYALTVYSAGLIFNTVFAAATAVFLLIGSKPLLYSIQRVKLKYGLWSRR